MGDDESYYSNKLPNRDPFRQVAVVIEVGMYETKIYDVRKGSWLKLPPKLLKKNHRIYGQKAVNQAKTRNKEVISPFKDGFVEDWEAWGDFFDLIFKESLYEAAVVMVETTPGQMDLERHRRQRQETAKVFLNSFKIDAYFVAPQPLFAMCSLQQNLNFKQLSGVVIDIGHSQTRVTPIYRGNTIIDCSFHTNIAGDFFNETLFKMIVLKNVNVDHKVRHEIEQVKHESCLVLPKAQLTNNALDSFDEKPELLDKFRQKVVCLEEVLVLDKERFLAAEVLFNPTVLPSGFSEKDSLSGLVKRSKSQFERFRKKLRDRQNHNYETEEAERIYKRFYIVGGSSKMSGMVERVKSEIEDIFVLEKIEKENLDKVEHYEEVKNELALEFIYEHNEEERGNSAAKGGLKFATESLNHKWLYNIQIENDPNLVIERCPK